jgi:hypothetical protein
MAQPTFAQPVCPPAFLPRVIMEADYARNAWEEAYRCARSGYVTFLYPLGGGGWGVTAYDARDAYDLSR